MAKAQANFVVINIIIIFIIIVMEQLAAALATAITILHTPPLR